MKLYLVISILLSLQLVELKSVEKGGTVKKASSAKPRKTPKSIVDQFSSLSTSDVDFIKELDKQFNIHGDKIKIKVEHENNTSTGEGKTNKRTINGELGYGYHQNYHSNGYYFTKPKFMIYPYSQHDIPPLNTNVQKHVEETVTDIQIQPSHSYEIKETNQDYHSNQYQHDYNNYHSQQNNYHQVQPNAIPVIVLKIPGPAKYAAHLQALLQQYLEIRAAQYIKAFEEQETHVHAAHSAQTVAPVQHYTPHHVAYVSMVPGHQLYAAVSPQYYMSPAPQHQAQPQYQHIYQTHHESPNYHSHHQHHHHQEEPEQQVVYHQQQHHHQVEEEQQQHQPEAPTQQHYQEEIEHDTPPPQYQHHPSSPQPHYEQSGEVEYEHHQAPSPSVNPYHHVVQHQQEQEEYHHQQQEPQESPRYVTPYQHHPSPAPHVHAHAHPVEDEHEGASHLETPENYPSDKHTRVIFKPKEPIPVPAAAQPAPLTPHSHHHSTPYNSQYFAQQNQEYYHQQEQNMDYTNDEPVVAITQKPYNYHAAGAHASTPQPLKRNAAKRESPYTEEQFKKLNRLINRLKKKSDVVRSDSKDHKE